MPDNQKPDLSVPKTQRVVRVFVSSTFRDMHAERDELMKFVFPELRRRCRERQVEFVEVDLRWGITEEETKQGKVLPICLAEIKRCKPYFIGLLGERYGWVPDTIPQEVIDQEPWLKEHTGKTGKSVTELEILHGVLNNPDMAEHAFFYFRDPAYIKSIPSERIKDFTAEDSAGAEKLLRLKEKIRQSRQTVRENYPDPKALGKRVLEDLWTVIDKKFPIEGVPTSLERERMDHEAFARARQKVYIGREIYFKRLDEHVASANPPLVILGESGSGKSALIANWIKRYKEAHPDDFMVTHFIGGTADSADHIKILRRIMEEIRNKYEPKKKEETEGGIRSFGKEKEDEIPTDSKKVVEQFPVWLAKASAKGKCILVLDALNQLEDKDNAPDLGWLPGFFPENVRVILSTLTAEKENASTAEDAEGAEKERDLTAKDAKGAEKAIWRRPCEALKRRGWPTLNIELLDDGERRVLVEKYLARFARKLSPKNMDTIVTAQQTSNPLYLKALLDELRVFGLHEELGKKIDDYLAAETVDDLYEKVLERLEKDYGQERKGLVSEAMSLIWASRRGLSETELLELLGKDKEPMPRAYWSSLYLALEESLVSRSGLLTFFHDYMRKAVEDRYFYDPKKKCLDAGKKRKEHIRLAGYFDKKEIDDRKVDELPWQLCQAESWERLKDCVINLKLFLKLMTEKKYELMGYWLKMGDRFDMVKEYIYSLNQYQQSQPVNETLAYVLNQMANFFSLNAKYNGAEPLYRRALEIYEKVLGQEHPDTVTSLYSLATLLRNKGDYVDAEPLFRRALEMRERLLGKDHPDTATSLDGLAGLLASKGDYYGAEPLYCRSLDIYERVLGKEHPYMATSLNNLALLLDNKGDYEGAEPLFRRALAITEKVLGSEHPDTALSLDNLAVLLHNKGDYDNAEFFYRRSLDIYERVLGKDHPDTVTNINNLAGLLCNKGDYEGAEQFYRKALEINERVLGKDHPNTATNLNNLAVLLREKGDHEGAETLLRRAVEIREQVLGKDHPHTAVSLNHLALLLDNKGDYEGAEPLFRRVLEIRERRLGKDHPYTATSLNNLALFLHKKGDYESAEPLFRRALEMRERLLGSDHPDTVQNINNLAELLRIKGDYVGAEPLFHRALAITEDVLGSEHPNTATILSNLAALLKDTNRFAEAEPLMRRAVEIFLKFSSQTGHLHPHLHATVNNYAVLLQAMGRSDGEIRTDLEKLGQCFGIDLTGAVGHANAEPSPKLRTLIEQLMRDPSKAQDIAAKLQREDPALFEELLRWIQQQEQQTQQKAYEELAAMEKTLGQEHPDTIAGIQNLANILYKKGDYAGAEPLYRKALAIMEKTLGQNHQGTVKSRDNLVTLLESKAELFKSKGDSATAESAYREALQIREKALGSDHPDTALSNNQLGVFLRNIGRPEDAEKYQRRALEIDEKVRKPDDPKIPHRLNNLAIVLTMQGKLDEAKRLFARAWKLKTSAHDITSVRILFSRIATAMMGKEPYGVCLGQMKALFGRPEMAYGANVSTTWNIEPIIKYIQPKISPEEGELLFFIGSATNDRSKLPELDRFPVWKDQPAVPLDVSW